MMQESFYHGYFFHENNTKRLLLKTCFSFSFFSFIIGKYKFYNWLNLLLVKALHLLDFSYPIIY